MLRHPSCTAPGAFETLVLVAAQADPSVELIPYDSRYGEGLFGEERLNCDLGTECYSAFDETLQMAVPVRVTPAQDMLGVGDAGCGSSASGTVMGRRRAVEQPRRIDDDKGSPSLGSPGIDGDGAGAVEQPPRHRWR